MLLATGRYPSCGVGGHRTSPRQCGPVEGTSPTSSTGGPSFRPSGQIAIVGYWDSLNRFRSLMVGAMVSVQAA